MKVIRNKKNEQSSFFRKNVLGVICILIGMAVTISEVRAQCPGTPSVPSTLTSPSAQSVRLCRGSSVTFNTNTSPQSNVQYVWYIAKWSELPTYTQFAVTSTPTVTYNINAASYSDFGTSIRVTVRTRYVGCANLSGQGPQIDRLIEGPPPTMTISMLPKRCNSLGGIQITSMTASGTNPPILMYYKLTISPTPPNGQSVYKFQESRPAATTGPTNGGFSVYKPTGVMYLPLETGVTYSYQLIQSYDNTSPPSESPCQPTMGTFPVVTDVTNQAPNLINLSATYFCDKITISSSGGYGAPPNSNNPNESYAYTFDGNNLWSWNGAPRTIDFSAQNPTVSLGNHTVVATDYLGCTASTNVNVNAYAPYFTGATLINQPCPGESTGSLAINSAGGVGPFQYQLGSSGYQSSNVFSNLQGPTNNLVTIKGSDNCISAPNSVVMGTLPIISHGTTGVQNPSCPSFNNGSITINGTSGGGGAFTYSLSGTAFRSFQTSNIFTDLSEGTYSVTIKDANNCSKTITNILLTNLAPVSASYSSTQASCSSVTDGSISVVSPSGGTGSYTYSLNYGTYTSFSTTSTFTGLPPGSAYVIKVRDGNSCEFTINNATVGIKPALTAGITQTAVINCFGQSAAALNLTAANGTPGYTYQWYKNNGAIAAPLGIAEDLSNIGAGTYKVTITDSKTCSITSADVVVTEPSAVTATITSSINVSCMGGSTASINLTASGGTPTYTYAWSNGQITEDISGLVAGNYTVTVTDSKGCTGTTSRVLTEPTTPVSFSSTTKTNVTCFGANNGTITVSASGGTGAIMYSINGSAYQVSNVFTGLAPNNYVITARDANGCTQTTSSISITSPTATLAISSITKANPICNGGNGSFTITATGGTAPYEYSRNGTTFNTSAILSGVSAGTYTLTVRDANGCSVNSTAQTLTNPAVLTFGSATTTPQSCAAVVDGNITVSASGGTGALQYSINGTTFQSSGVFNGLTAGGYTVTVRDANSCTATTPVTVTTVTAVNGIITQTAFINCFNQATAALSVSASGGTSPYSYTWSNGSTLLSASGLAAGNHTVVITDSKGCTATKPFTITQPSQLATNLTTSDFNGFGISCTGATDGFINQTISGGTSPFTYAWSNGANIKDISSLSSGAYSLTVTDSKGCSTNGAATLTAPTVVVASIDTKTHVTCHDGNDGTITVTGEGGTGIYTYSRNGGINWQPTPVFSTLTVDTYTLTLRDQNNCQAQVVTAITQPVAVTVSINTVIDATCGGANGSATATGSGGGESFTYSWRNVANDIVSTTSSLTAVGSGTYTVTVQDQAGCATSASTAISSSDGAQFTVASLVGVTCPENTNGSAEVIINSGQGPYTIQWSNGESGLTANTLPGGANSVTVIDANACEVVQSFTVPSPTAITLSSIDNTLPTCPGTNTASVLVQASGGAGGYTYEWDGVAGTNARVNVEPGAYQLRVTDALSCELNQTIVVNDLVPITLNVVSQSLPTCSSSADGIVTIQAQGGNGSFSYAWPGTLQGAQLTNALAGAYEVTVTDLNGCTHVETITLLAPDPVTLTINAINQISCSGLQDGSLTISANGGTGSYEYSINNGQSWQSGTTFTELAADDYILQSRDGNGCEATTVASIVQPDILTVHVDDITHTTCNGVNGSATGVVFGGTGTYTYTWLNTANQEVNTQASFTEAPAGVYTLMVHDENNCSATSAPVTINSSTTSTVQLTSIQPTSCVNAADGTAMLVVESGPGPHSVAWSSGETGSTATQLTGGTSSVSVTDGNSCVVTTTFQVPTPVPISLASAIITDPSCPGTASGSIQVLATGGAGAFVYSWNGVTGTNALQNLVAGTYTLQVKDAKNCVHTQSITLLDLPTIKINAEQVREPTCAGGSDGQISVTATGGNEFFVYSWNTGAEGAVLNNIAKGAYQVTATDRIGCAASTTINLSEPLPFVFELGPDKTICVGQVFAVSAPVDNATYLWTSGDGSFSSTNREVQISLPGEYTLKIVNEKGCRAEDSFRVVTSSTLLTADFLAVSEAVEGDSILLIDISWPLPESTTWSLPTDARVIEKTNDYAIIIFDKAGIYGLSVNARLGQCSSTYSRFITIHHKSEDTGTDVRQADEPLVKSFTAFPNPSEGDFTVSVALREPEDVKLLLVSPGHDAIVWKGEHTGTTLITFDVKQERLPSGLYFLVLTVKGQTKVMRIIRR